MSKWIIALAVLLLLKVLAVAEDTVTMPDWSKPNEVLAFVESGYDINSQDEEGMTPLSHAANSGNVKSAKILIEAGADVNGENSTSFTPLFGVAIRGYVEMAELLISAGANVSHRNFMDTTPLHLATQIGSIEMVGYLIQMGADINAKDYSGNTPLFTAWVSEFGLPHPMHDLVASSRVSIVRILLDAGADIELTNNNGHTPLLAAAIEDRTEIVRCLLLFGAETEHRDFYGRTFADILRDNRRSSRGFGSDFFSPGITTHETIRDSLINRLPSYNSPSIGEIYEYGFGYGYGFSEDLLIKPGTVPNPTCAVRPF